MTEGCDYCNKEFDKEKRRLQHELKDHDEEMSGHDKSDKKSRLNKLQQKKQVNKHNRRKKLQYGAVGILLIGLVVGGGYWTLQNSDFGEGQPNNHAIGVGEPVHWHADYQITVCGDDRVLQGGPTKAHTHGERTFHLEGVRTSREEATLDWIVDSLGGKLEEDSIMGRTSCNGESANLTVKANGNELEEPLDYIVRDGDFIKITFG